MIVETDAVVLRSIDYGDTSKIVTLYTKRYGKIKVIAKGVRSQRNKFGSSLETMTVSSVVLYKKEHRDLHLLSKSEIRTPLKRIQDDTDRLFTALALVELVNMVMHDEEENSAVFAMLTDALQTIDESTRNHINVLLSFMLKMFAQFGFGIGLNDCSVCRKTLTGGGLPFVYLRLSDGTLICPDCSGRGKMSGVRFDGGILTSLQYLNHSAITKAPILTIDRSKIGEVMTIVQSYLHYHSDGSRTLKSLSLLFSQAEVQKNF